MSEPAADDVDLDAGFEEVDGWVWRKMCGLTRRHGAERMGPAEAAFLIDIGGGISKPPKENDHDTGSPALVLLL